jgi:hypothetical protein
LEQEDIDYEGVGDDIEGMDMNVEIAKNVD